MDEFKEFMKEFSGWIVAAGSGIAWFYKSRQEKKQINKSLQKSDAEIDKIDIDNKKSLTDQLDSAWDKTEVMRKQINDQQIVIKKYEEVIEQLQEEIIDLRRKVNLLETIRPLLKQHEISKDTGKSGDAST